MVRVQKGHLTIAKMMTSIVLLFPMISHAHLIAITNTVPFPASIPANGTAIASFTVTNITSRVNVTAVDQSQFAGTGISISASTCGNLLRPQEACTIQLTLNAPTTQTVISTELKVWAKPSVDAVKFPIRISVTPAPNLPTITLVPISNQLPAFRDPVVARSDDNWLILSGSTGAFHNFNNIFNTRIYVYNPNTGQIHSVSINDTDLDTEVKKQLSASSPQFVQDGDFFYIVGGFYTADELNWETLQTITSIDVPGMTQAVINGSTALNQFVRFRTDIPQFKVTGGQLGKIGDDFYLAYGQNCGGTLAEGGSYCGGTQVYTDSIYRFRTDSTLATTAILQTVTHADNDNSGWRRRDYTLTPFKLGNVETLFAMAGPFTQSQNTPLVWTNGIIFDNNLVSNDRFINQQANQYSSASLSMFSESSGKSYVATFSGLSNLFWTENGLTYNNNLVGNENGGAAPYGNILDLISYDSATRSVQEYANLQPMCSGQPLANCLYMGLGTEFIHINRYSDARGIIQLDQLTPNTQNLVGYLYAGLLSTSQAIFVFPPPPPNPPDGTPGNESYTTNNIYAVYVNPSAPSVTSWKNITNLYPGS